MVKSSTYLVLTTKQQNQVTTASCPSEENRKGKQEATVSLAAAKEDSVLAKGVAVYLKEVDGIFTFKNEDK